MRAVLRLGGVVMAVGLALAPAPLLAQDAATTADPPATDVVGPRDLQNFSLNGTVTRSAEPVAAPRSANSAAATRAPATTGDSGAAATSRQAAAAAGARRARSASGPDRPLGSRAEPFRAGPGSFRSSFAVRRPPPFRRPQRPRPRTPRRRRPASPVSRKALAGEHRLLLWPWLLAALMLGAAGAFLFLRHRSREAFAGEAGFDAFRRLKQRPRRRGRPPRPSRPRLRRRSRAESCRLACARGSRSSSSRSASSSTSARWRSSSSCVCRIRAMPRPAASSSRPACSTPVPTRTARSAPFSRARSERASGSPPSIP